MSESVCIKTFTTRLEAQFAQGLLRSCGIPSFIIADDAGGTAPLLTLLGPGAVRLFVKRRNGKKAAEVLGMDPIYDGKPQS
jgi:hypothetical protein